MRLLIRFSATLLALAGLAALAASMAALVWLDEDSASRPLVTIVVQTALVCLVGGVAAIYVSRTRRVFPGDDAAPPTVGILESIVAAGLVALPVWMVRQLQPFLAGWREVAELGAGSRMWADASSTAGGLVLVPVAIVLTPPFVELLTMAAFVLTSVALLICLVLRRPALPRWYTAWIVILSALVFASARGATAASEAALVVKRALDRSDRHADEATQIRSFVERYAGDVNTAAAVLAWTLVGYASLLALAWISNTRRARG